MPNPKLKIALNITKVCGCWNALDEHLDKQNEPSCMRGPDRHNHLSALCAADVLLLMQPKCQCLLLPDMLFMRSKLSL